VWPSNHVMWGLPALDQQQGNSKPAADTPQQTLMVWE